MSLRRKKYISFNRAKDKEERALMIESMLNCSSIDLIDYDWDSDDPYWFLLYTSYYPAPSSMEELAQLRIMTLLRFLDIKTADEFLADRGW